MSEPAPQSPAWWLRRLEGKLTDRAKYVDRMNRYYSGDHPLPIVRDKLRRDFERMLRMSKSNFCEIVVDAVEERLNVEGFRVGGDDVAADRRAWEIWQANQLDAESQVAHADALVAGVTNVTVWRSRNDDTPRIAVEDPLETIVEYAPGDRRRRAAGLKLWKDEWTGRNRADVWLPDAIYSFERLKDGQWRQFGEDNRNAHPLGVVPMVPLVNKPRARWWGRSELEVAIPSQDRINKLLFDMMLASELASFRQRWVTGMDIPVDPDTNEPVQPFKAAIDELWIDENPETKFGEFDVTPLEPYQKGIEQSVLHIAVQTRTPRHYLIEQGQSPSGDAIKSAETGLVAKARRKMRHFGEAWEEVMRLARRFDGQSSPADSEVVWADPEYRSEGEIVDAAVKKVTSLGVPAQQVWEDIGYSPQQIRRFSVMRAQDAIRQLMTAPPAESAEEESA